MIVVADSSPLHYLILLECVEVLAPLFGEVMVPPQVFAELTMPARHILCANGCDNLLPG